MESTSITLSSPLDIVGGKLRDSMAKVEAQHDYV